MRIVPVIDLRNGQVVRGVGGRRDEYQPVRSVLCPTASPGDVARAFVERLGLPELYVADLDALAGQPVDATALQAIARAGTSILLDAGVRDPQQARALSCHVAAAGAWPGLIVALETLPDEVSLARVAAVLGSQRAVFSLDLRDGQPWTTAMAWRGLDALQIAERAYAAGFRRFVLLDVAYVGTNVGPAIAPLCRQFRSRWPDCELISGGGVRDAGDLAAFAEAGCSAVLVASALHTGRLTRDDLESLR